MVLLLPVTSEAEISKPNAPDDKARTKAILVRRRCSRQTYVRLQRPELDKQTLRGTLRR